MSDTTSINIDGTHHEFELTFDKAYWDAEAKISEDGMRAVVVYLSQDDDAANPREEFDHVGKMVCWHSRYNLGDEQRTDDASDFFKELAAVYDPDIYYFCERLGNKRWNSLGSTYEERDREMTRLEHERVMKTLDKHYIMLPLYLYDHSGITMSTGKFSCPWDSGQVGWIYCTIEKAMEE